MTTGMTGGCKSGGTPRFNAPSLARLDTRRRGVILLAVLVFVALLLPLITLVLTSINTESVSTAEAIKGAKAEMAAEKAINDAISLVVQEKAYPQYYTSVTQPNTAIIVLDPVSGFRRDVVPDNGSGGAGLDDLYGTDDDYWLGPRFDRSHIGPDDDETSSRMYRWGFRYPNMHGPTYLGQSWSFSTEYLPYARSPLTGGPDNWIWMFNQFAAVQVDADGDGIDDGYDSTDPFDGGSENGLLYGPGYFPGANEPSGGALGDRLLDGSNSVEEYMYNAKVNLYNSIYTDLGRGPIPTSLLKSFADVSDEAGRLNLNIFCKKARVYMPESAETDYDAEGYGTNDFNLNEVVDEEGFKWMDNPLFPDRLTTIKWEFNPNTGAFTANSSDEFIDWGSINLQNGQFSDAQDGVAMPELGESVQHFYEGDTDGDGIPQSIEACRMSLEMLMTLPGVTPRLAAEILTYLNPPHDAGGTDPDRDPWGPGLGTYPTLHSDLNGPSTLPYDSPPLSTAVWYSVDPVGDYPGTRVDACNITPPLLALDVTTTGGVVDEYRWAFDFTTEDDLPLPPPRPLKTIDHLLDLPSMSERRLERLRDYITIHSYDTNVIANYIQDVGPNTDLVNAFVPGDPEYNGSVALRETPEDMRDDDNVPDLRYDVSRFVFGITTEDYREAASEMYAHVRAHLPRTLKDKITLPPVDRLGRAGSEDHLVPNTDPRYNLSDPTQPSVLIPSRDSDGNVDSTGYSHPYNVGSYGHQENWSEGGNNLPGAGYPALNPSFDLNSCLSILMYRNGTFFEADDYTYDPDSGAWRSSADRAPGWLLSLFGQAGAWFWEVFWPSSNAPVPYQGENVNPFVRPHGAGVFDYANLLNPGGFDSPADLLDVPRYEFGHMSVGLMADPPSDFRYDFNANGDVDSGAPEELSAVNYYISFSDVVDAGWYMSNVHPDGPDDRPGTGDEPDMNAVLYMLQFTIGNRPGLNWDDPTSSNVECVIPLTPMQLRGVGAGADGTSNKVTIVAHDNFNNLDVLSYRFTESPSFQTYVAPLGGRGTLTHRFGWDDVPEPETPIGSDTDARPLEANYWNVAGVDDEPDYPGSQFGTSAERQAWAFSSAGDPYLTARVEVRKWDDANDTEALPNVRADEETQVYLQYNEEADIPFRVDVLPVRVAGDQFELRSAYGGAETDGGTYLLYDWDYSGVPDSYDGTWPPQGWQTGDPRVIRITPDGANVILRLYDLRTFVDAPSSLPLPPGDFTSPTAIGSPIVSGDEVQLPPLFPLDPAYGGTYPVPGTVGYATDAVQVSLITTSPIVEAQMTAEEPSVWADDTNARFFASAVGGTMPYTYRARVLDPSFGSGAGGTSPYVGPDAAPGSGFTINDWPGLGVPPRLSRVTAPGIPYDTTVVGSVLDEITRVSNDISEAFAFDPVALGLTGSNGYGGAYWVELTVTDSAGAPASDVVYTKLVLSGDTGPAGSTGIPPNMNASINLRPLEEGRRGFVCSASADGGQGGYNYRWEIHRPRYSDDPNEPDTIVGTEIVDSSAPFLSIDSTNPGGPGASSIPMVSNEPNPTFEFHTRDVYNNDTGNPGSDGIRDSDGVYFVHCYVFDHASSYPGGVNATVAHDVGMVTITDSGVVAGGPPSAGSLARTPMALLHAHPPGNGNAEIGDNPRGAGGTSMPFIGAVDNPATPDIEQALDPDVAANGDVVVIRGFNFAAPSPPAPGGIPGPHPNGDAGDNIVTFGGGVSTSAFDVNDDGISLDIGGTVYRQMALYVRVPDGARSGYLTVTTPLGTSERVFFQTGFHVTFDLIGKMSPADPTYLNFELDYQGDGHIDYSFNTLGNPGAPGQIRGSQRGINHDYAADGIGNYTATLVVTDLISGRKAVSHQLITIKDLRPLEDTFVTISAGQVTDLGSVSGLFPTATFSDTFANFLVDGVRTGDRIINTSLTPNQLASVLEVFNEQEIATTELNGGGSWAVGDNYEIRRYLDFEGANGMLVNIYPEIDIRSETFTADPDEGVAFGSAVGGAGTGLYYKWQIDRHDQPGGTVGGGAIGSSTAKRTDLSGVTLYDDAVNFTTWGPFGVREDDLVIVHERDDDGPPPSSGNGEAYADVHRVVSPVELELHDPADPTFTVGLNYGSDITRLGVVTNIVGSNPGVSYVIEDDNYDWVGDGASLTYGVYMGGILADNNPNTPGVGDFIVNLTNDNSLWLVIDDYISDPTLEFDQIRVDYAGPPVGQQDAIVIAVMPPTTWDARILLNIGAYPEWDDGPGTILHDDTNNSTWRIRYVDLATNEMELQALGGPNVINVGDQVRVNPIGANGPAPPAWTPGDEWRVIIPANQWRIGYDYAIYTADGSDFDSWADATYASVNAPVDFYISLRFPFDLDPTSSNPTIVRVDWDDDGTIDSIYAVGDSSRLDGAVNGLEIESLRITHGFTAAELGGPVGTPGGAPTQAVYYADVTPLDVAFATRYGPYALPIVTVGGDDYDTDLSTLNVENWNNDSWHRVTLETSYEIVTTLMDLPLAGTSNMLERGFFASDQMMVPPGLQDYTDTMATWVSYTQPFISANNYGVTTMRHQAVHGIGSALNWVSDVNADTIWLAGANESPLGDNPVNYHEFTFQNGPNLMNVPGAGPIKGASFPAAVTGVGQAGVSGNFLYYRANRGVYNGFGFVQDNLPLQSTLAGPPAGSEAAFSFDSQALFWGDRLQGQQNERRPLVADFEVEPLVGSNSQLVQLTSYVTGGAQLNSTYTYRWFIEKFTGTSTGMVGLDGPYVSGPSSVTPNPVFSPWLDISDETWYGAGDDGSGRFWVWLVVGDGSGAYTACRREFNISAPALSINLMANPPSGSVGDEIQYAVFVDGGIPPYTLSFDFDGDGATDITRTLNRGNESTASWIFSESGAYNSSVTVTDDAGAGDSDSDSTIVEIAETIPLNADLIVTPSSGVAPFLIYVNYSVSGGRRMSGGGYNVSAMLVNVNGEVVGSTTREERNTFGANGVLDDPRLPTSDDEPILFVVPQPGNYYVMLLVSDNGGAVKTRTDDVFASGYMMPTSYGEIAPQVARDGEGRPMHAMRIWVDPFLSIDSSSDNSFENLPTTDFGGGRLLEADLQVLGDVLGIDPNVSYRSYGMYATKDPLEQPLYYANYTLDASGDEQIQDFYDTYTIGRININTASEDVLTALFMKIVKERAYEYLVDYDLDGNGTATYRAVRDPLNDIYLSAGEARQLAQRVIRYRTAYYDLHKPEPPDTNGDFGYVQTSFSGAYPELGGAFRVDHLPVIGPWDGTNPHEYGKDDRNAELAAPDNSGTNNINNAWDNMAATYYNFDAGEYMFYSPSDIAVVRDRWEADVNVTVQLPSGPLSFSRHLFEPPANYAKYLNDVMHNGAWDSNRGGEMGDWVGSGLYQVGNDHYSRWAFDARNYFTYPGGEYDIGVTFDPATGDVTFTPPTPVPGSFGLPEDARNEIAIIDSNEITAHTYIANPPFRHLFDLFKVIDAVYEPQTYPLEDIGTGYYLETDDDGFTPEDGDYAANPSNTSYQVFSGPSAFRYVARWDDERSEFIPIANYLDDIAPYVTCRSYVFRVDAYGAVTASGSTAGALVDTAKISRDRSKSAIIDVGPMWARRDAPLLNDILQGAGITAPDRDLSYRILWYNDETR